jgi:HSP20 family protein
MTCRLDARTLPHVNDIETTCVRPWERLFEQNLPGPNRGWLPVDVFKTAMAVEIRTALPGIKPEDVDVSIAGDILTIRGEFKADEEQEDKHCRRRELYVGAFERSLRLPERFEVEKAEPIFENGILTITIPKGEQAEVTHIKVKASRARH